MSAVAVLMPHLDLHAALWVNLYHLLANVIDLVQEVFVGLDHFLCTDCRAEGGREESQVSPDSDRGTEGKRKGKGEKGRDKGRPTDLCGTSGFHLGMQPSQ